MERFIHAPSYLRDEVLMPNTLLLDQKLYTVTTDSEKIRSLESYVAVREEINGRFTPFAGGTDWQVVLKESEALAQGEGIDLLMSSYLSIAKLKLEGVAGFANGLELVLSCLMQLSKPDTKAAKMRKDILSWINQKAIPEIKNMKPNHELLKDLYRSERMCERIHEWMSLQQPKHEVDFEGLGFVLFEHIDRIETQYHTLVKRQEKQQVEPQSAGSRNRSTINAFLASLLTAAACIGGFWLYLNPYVLNEYQYKSWRSVPTLDATRAEAFLNNTSAEQLRLYRDKLVPLYQAEINERLKKAADEPYRHLLDQLSVLQTLYSEDQQVNALTHSVAKEREAALDQVNLMIERFGLARTQMANISKLVKSKRWADVEAQAKRLEDYAVSLSPIYGRADFIQALLEQKQFQRAEDELLELRNRLNNLAWQTVELNQRLEKEKKEMSL